MDAGTLSLIILLSARSAQAPPAAHPRAAAPAVSTPAPSPPVRWALGLEYRRDRFDYRFENPSTFNTAEPVPHFFEQSHDADNTWLAGRLLFTLGTRPFETEAGMSVAATGASSDCDTFYQPDGNVVVYGTTADTDIRSWRAAQHVGLGSWHAVQWRAAYSYQRDRADFRPSFTITTQTKPPSSAQFWNTDRETTISEVHEIRLGAARTFASDPSWRVRVTADAAPVTLARLSTILPDKYSEPVVFIAKAFSVNAAFEVMRRLGPWHAGVSVSYAQAWSYQQANGYHRKAVAAAAVVGR